MLAASAPGCPLCGRVRAPLWLVKNGHRIYRCPECELGFVHPAPEKRLAAVFGPAETGGAPGSAERGRRRPVRVRHWRTVLRRLGYRGRRALDIGCGDGWWLAGLAEDHPVLCGVEPDDHARTRASQRVGGGRIVASIAAVPADEPFDLVTMFDHLEHVPDPNHAMAEARHRLAPGGFLAVSVPIADHWSARWRPEQWEQVRPPEQLTYYTRRSLLRLLDLHRFGGVYDAEAWPRWPRALRRPLRLPLKILGHLRREDRVRVDEAAFVVARRND